MMQHRQLGHLAGLSSLLGLMFAGTPASHGGIPLASLPRRARRCLTSPTLRELWNGGGHKPHQGARECERRRRQMANHTHGY